jgi:hypothetical protein
MATVNLPAVRQDNETQMVPAGESWWEDRDKFELIQRAARMFSTSPLVPEQYRGDKGLGSCVIALNMAHRMGADPLMVMQNLYVVHGRPSWSAQFLIACFNQTGRFSPIRYQWSGKEGDDDWGCTAWSTDRETGERIEGPLITIGTAKAEGWAGKKGSKWQTIPRLMLMYRAASWLVRTHAPELAMGLRTADEERDIAMSDRDDHFPAASLNGGSRSDQVADLLEGEVVAADDADAEAEASVDVDADGEPGGESEPAGDGSVDELVESMLRRIADAGDSDELQAINDEVSVMNQQSHLPTKDVTTLKKAIKSRREEMEAASKKPQGSLL